MEITLTPSQQKAFDRLIRFVESPNDRIFILKGYAGTGKTTLMRFLIKKLTDKKLPFMLLAPTGRAAKVLSNITGHTAQTIHSLIYSFTNLNKDLSAVKKEDLVIDKVGQIYLNFEPTQLDEYEIPPTIYIVDEASMVADIEEKIITQAKFGSGKLLTELLNYDTRTESKFIFVGDPCQLPPVQEITSPALLSDYFKEHFGIKPLEDTLTEIVRQKEENDLIRVSQLIREQRNLMPDTERSYKMQTWARFPLRNCNNVQLHLSIEQMLESYIADVQQNGYNNSIFVCASNRKCYDISMAARKLLNFNENCLQKGDLLMVVQNNMPSGLMNGDMVEIEKIDSRKEIRANLIFQSTVVRELFTNQSKSVLLLTSTITNGTLNLDSHQQTELFLDFIYRMKNKNINKKFFNKAMQTDPYLNALRCMYGYAVTCHKAQGGEWNNVYVDFGLIARNPTKEKYQWTYTAITRAKEILHVLNKPYIQ